MFACISFLVTPPLSFSFSSRSTLLLSSLSYSFCLSAPPSFCLSVFLSAHLRGRGCVGGCLCAWVTGAASSASLWNTICAAFPPLDDHATQQMFPLFIRLFDTFTAWVRLLHTISSFLRIFFIFLSPVKKKNLIYITSTNKTAIVLCNE